MRDALYFLTGLLPCCFAAWHHGEPLDFASALIVARLAVSVGTWCDAH